MLTGRKHPERMGPRWLRSKIFDVSANFLSLTTTFLLFTFAHQVTSTSIASPNLEARQGQKTSESGSDQVPFRWGHSAVTVGDRIIFIGGVEESTAQGVNGTFALATLPTIAFAPNRSTVSVLSTSGSLPASIGHSCTFVDADRSIYCHGGFPNTSPAFSPQSRRGIWRFGVDGGLWSGGAIDGFSNVNSTRVDDTGIADASMQWINNALLVVGGRSTCYTCTPQPAGLVAVQGFFELRDKSTRTIVHEPLGGLYGHCTVSSGTEVVALFGTTPQGPPSSLVTRVSVSASPGAITTVTPVTTAANEPAARLYAVCQLVNTTTVMISGGMAPDGTFLTDEWSFSLATLSFTSVAATGIMPAPRIRAAGFTLADGTPALHGGLRRDLVADRAIYSQNSATGRWEQLLVTANMTVPPPPPQSAADGLQQPEQVSKWLTIGLPVAVGIIALIVLLLSIVLCRLCRLQSTPQHEKQHVDVMESQQSLGANWRISNAPYVNTSMESPPRTNPPAPVYWGADRSAPATALGNSPPRRSTESQRTISVPDHQKRGTSSDSDTPTLSPPKRRSSFHPPPETMLQQFSNTAASEPMPAQAASTVATLSNSGTASRDTKRDVFPSLRTESDAIKNDSWSFYPSDISEFLQQKITQELHGGISPISDTSTDRLGSTRDSLSRSGTLSSSRQSLTPRAAPVPTSTSTGGSSFFIPPLPPMPPTKFSGAGATGSSSSSPTLDLTKPYTAMHAHIPSRTDEVTIAPTDTLTVRKLYRDGWAVGMNVSRGCAGYFPIGVLDLTGYDALSGLSTSGMRDDSDHLRESDNQFTIGISESMANGAAGNTQHPSSKDGSSRVSKRLDAGDTSSNNTLFSPPQNTLTALEELDWAYEMGVVNLESYFRQRKRIFFAKSLGNA
ncbi:hypothetical protein DFS34DRAFT_382524 [Phlyctochytrium arcticum]|nr:hypothetical protein DFS34DRAFT_382524 [Phlyctochytrium arcticum]